MIRTLQYHGIHQGLDVYMECTITACSRTATAWSAPSRTGARAAAWWCSRRRRDPRRRGHRQGVEDQSNSWEYTATAIRCPVAGADLIDMEFVQFTRRGWCGRPRTGSIVPSRATARRDAEEQRRQALHVLTTSSLQRGDGRQRGRGRPLVRGQEEQPPHARLLRRRGRAGDQLPR